MNKIIVVITARGRGTRMQGFSPLPKENLYMKDLRVIDYIKLCFEVQDISVEVLQGGPDNSRAETLELLRGRKNVLICDCDIIPIGWQKGLILDEDWIWYFISNNPKYGGLYEDDKGRLVRVVEKGDELTMCRSSGLYFLKDVGETIDKMTDPNSIASGMIGAKMIAETTFIRLGDPEDYLAAILK